MVRLRGAMQSRMLCGRVEVSYQTQAYSALFGFAIHLDTDAKIAEAIDQQAKIELVDQGHNGSTVIGHLNCQQDGSFLFEGLTGNIKLAIGTNTTTVVDQWNTFVKRQITRAEKMA